MSSTATLSAASSFGADMFGSQPDFGFQMTEGGEDWFDKNPNNNTWFSISIADTVTIDTNLTALNLEAILAATARHHKSKVQEGGNAKKTPNIPRICIAADALASKLAQTEEAQMQMMKDVKGCYGTHPKSRWISVADSKDRKKAKEVKDSTRLIQPEGERFITALKGRTPSISIDDPGYESKVERLVQAMYAAGWIEASKNTKQRLDLYDAIKDLDVDL
jgi:hypothetical protein